MTFVLPEYLLLLLTLPILCLGAALSRRRVARRTELLIGKRLQAILCQPLSVKRGWATLSSLIIALALVIISLASPSAGYREAREKIRARSIMIALDVSRSMFATDLKPSRLDAAKAAALELLERFPEDRIGLIAFSGNAWVQAPLTLDHDALRTTLQQLGRATAGSTDWIPRDGSDLPSAVRLAVRTLRTYEQPDSSLIILSDGETHQKGIQEAAYEAAAEGIMIFPVGFGTPEGSLIPDSSSPDGNFYDREGSLVISSLDREGLSILSDTTGGTYSEGAGQEFLSQVETAVERMKSAELEGSGIQIANPLFQWFLGPSILLLCTGMVLRSGYPLRSRMRQQSPEHQTSPPLSAHPRNSGYLLTLPLIMFVVLTLTLSSKAAPLLPIPATKALIEGDSKKALLLFEREIATSRGERKIRLSLGAGAAAYRMDDYASALTHYSNALLSSDPEVQQQAHFGIGNLSYYRGLKSLSTSPGSTMTVGYWNDAISHFRQLLHVDPSNLKAAQNLAYVERKLDEHSRNLLSEPNEDPENDKDDPLEQSQESRNGENKEQPQTSETATSQEPAIPSSNPEKPGPDTPPSIPPERAANPDSETDPPPGPEEPIPGETPEEFARRILRDNADFETKLIPRNISQGQRPKRDW